MMTAAKKCQIIDGLDADKTNFKYYTGSQGVHQGLISQADGRLRGRRLRICDGCRLRLWSDLEKSFY